eukprot:g15422.t1
MLVARSGILELAGRRSLLLRHRASKRSRQRPLAHGPLYDLAVAQNGQAVRFAQFQPHSLAGTSTLMPPRLRSLAEGLAVAGSTRCVLPRVSTSCSQRVAPACHTRQLSQRATSRYQVFPFPSRRALSTLKAHLLAGPQLAQHLLKLPASPTGVRCPTGKAVLSPSFRLKMLSGASRIVHVVAPFYPKTCSDRQAWKQAMLACYHSAFALGFSQPQLDLDMVLLCPLLGAGARGGSEGDCVQVAAEAGTRWLNKISVVGTTSTSKSSSSNSNNQITANVYFSIINTSDNVIIKTSANVGHGNQRKNNYDI